MRSQTIEIGQIYRIKADKENGKTPKDESTRDICSSENLRNHVILIVRKAFLFTNQRSLFPKEGKVKVSFSQFIHKTSK